MIWIEIKCDKRAYLDKDGNFTNGCWSDDNSDPSASSLNTLADLSKSFAYVKDVALKSGWVKINGEWICPHCQEN